GHRPARGRGRRGSPARLPAQRPGVPLCPGPGGAGLEKEEQTMSNATTGAANELIVGIDLGTTNSEVAYVRDGQPHVGTEDGDPILPSFVGLSDDGRLLVGKAARNQWAVAPERTIKSIKRKMGQDVKVQLGDQEYRPQEISAMILRKLRDRASEELG